MKLIMDIQAMQSEGSRGRGIGRYTEELTKHTLQNLKKGEVKLFLNGLYPEHTKSIEKYMGEGISKENYIFYSPIDLISKEFDQREKYNKLNTILIKEKLNSIKNQEVLHIHSLFEGLGGSATVMTNFSNIKSQIVVTLYDLIPLIYKEEYLSDIYTKNWYYRVIKLFYEADLILAISEATKEDAINILGIPEDKIINISGAIDNKKFFKIEDITLKKYQRVLDKFDITQPFIMYTGGIDFRKNINKSIEAFSQIDKELFNNYQYVIVCKINHEEREKFKKLIKNLNIPKNKIIFTGFVSDDDLNKLYNLAKLFIFPSIYEGFGLPILEAMSCGRAVIGSNTSSIPEIIGREDALFNTKNSQDIANKINQVLKDKRLLQELEEHSILQSKKFSWDNSSKRAIEGYNTVISKDKKNIKKFKIALFTPLPNMRSGISDYSLELIPFLSKYVDIDIFIDDYDISSDYINANYNIFDYRVFDKIHHTYSSIIYQFGNSEFHSYMYDIALNHPGIIVLHDFYLSELINYIAHKDNLKNFFFDNLIYAHGKEGEEQKEKILTNQIEIKSVIKNFPINKKIIDSASAIIVHSEYSKTLFKKFYNDNYNVTKIEQLIKTPSIKALTKKEKYRAELNIGKEEIIISAFGHISDTKQYDFILEAFVKANIFKNQKVKLFFVGEFSSPIYQEKILSYIKHHKIQDRVIITGFVSDELYKTYLLSSNIALNLRINSRGETSRALLMNMAYGLPTIINDYATFSELPDETVCKVKLEVQQDFIDKLTHLIDDAKYRENISNRAYEYIVTDHHIDNIVNQYHNVIKSSIMKNQTSSKDILEELATTIVENRLDYELSEKEYITIATTIKENLS